MGSAAQLDKRRRKLPAAIVHAVHLEAGFQCARPQCRILLVLDCHHIAWVKDGGGDDQSNLICLCPSCHAMYHRGIISDDAIWHWKALLVAMNHAFDRKSMDMLLTISDVPSMWYGGGELLSMSSLLQAKLIEIRDMDAASPGSAMTGRFRVETTIRGELLIDAWKSGESEKYRLLLASNPAGETQ
jgi:hypothetical protein